MIDLNDLKWQALLAASAPSFKGDDTPPLGFAARTMAHVRAERARGELMLRLGWRALLASFAVALIAAVGATWNGLASRENSALEPGLTRIIDAENLPFS